ncbi:putative cellulose-binding protein [Anopheles sinensis]|uniref:Putative cellulose-binding protein n=1 Tax=Anopheles sinensis TaxID=74873 RepID=A0A084WDA3_ANOSI|nr:putative cellulose-binding protein [Anopheles sinensis]
MDAMANKDIRFREGRFMLVYSKTSRMVGIGRQPPGTSGSKQLLAKNPFLSIRAFASAVRWRHGQHNPEARLEWTVLDDGWLKANEPVARSGDLCMSA